MLALTNFYEQHQIRRQQWIDPLPLSKKKGGQCSPKLGSTSQICSREQIDAAMREVGAPLRFRIANEYTPASGGSPEPPGQRGAQSGPGRELGDGVGRRGGLALHFTSKCGQVVRGSRAGNDEQEEIGDADETNLLASPKAQEYASNLQHGMTSMLR